MQYEPCIATFKYVTDYRHCAETQDHRVEGSKTASNATLYIDCRSILLTDHCSHFSYLLPHYVLLPPPSLCIYRGFRATFTIKSFIQSSTLQSLQLWAQIAQPAEQLPGSHHLLTNQLPHLRSHYFYHLCSALSFFIYQTNGRLTLTDERTQLTNELTNQIKSLKR